MGASAGIGTRQVPERGLASVRAEIFQPEMVAYVPLTKRRLVLRALTAAQDELRQWAALHARMLTEIPPREVHVADIMVAYEDDHGCDVTLPFEPRR